MQPAHYINDRSSLLGAAQIILASQTSRSIHNQVSVVHQQHSLFLVTSQEI